VNCQRLGACRPSGPAQPNMSASAPPSSVGGRAAERLDPDLLPQRDRVPLLPDVSLIPHVHAGRPNDGTPRYRSHPGRRCSRKIAPPWFGVLLGGHAWQGPLPGARADPFMIRSIAVRWPRRRLLHPFQQHPHPAWPTRIRRSLGTMNYPASDACCPRHNTRLHAVFRRAQHRIRGPPGAPMRQIQGCIRWRRPGSGRNRQATL